ncbi:UPF0280 family protein [Desulfopila inferna]|uniref:UPF0280 family protein n=1 Tax=Desulfopila inferna TaxID=468528 RepID=UPI0019635399|nr:UPF0280 family protein [Desulfopila inferna]MBM9605162.1 UPF0280 family protein [Desulfopila inferna]
MKSKQRRKKPESYTIRSYRGQAQAAGLIQVHVLIKETDLHIQADRDVQRRAEEIVLQCRLQLEDHIIRYPAFYSSLSPLSKDFAAPPLIRDMYDAARKANVGPMAAVAGGIAEYVGRTLLQEGVQEIIIENGGDIFISRKQSAVIAIFAGESPLSNRVGIELSVPMPWGVCTSSGTVGHSLSMGEADSVTVVARSTLLADTAATRLGNEVGRGAAGKERVKQALAAAKTIEGITGVVVICGEVLGAVGDIRLVRVKEGSK